jgi:hypothetical protein
MLQHRREPFEAHPRVDRGLGKGMHRSGLVAIELHEDEVPDLDVAVPFGFRRSGRTPCDLGTMVVEDLRTRAAGARVAHLPEVVALEPAPAGLVADADAAVLGNADIVRPEIERLVVGLVHGGPELFLRQPVHDRQQLPCVADRVALEVVPEAEVAEHLEERVMARGVADVLEVVVLAARAHAALRGDGADVGALVQPEEDVLELASPRW